MPQGQQHSDSSHQQTRRLAAVLFADLVDYTALMQADEHRASGLLRSFQSGIKAGVEQHQGRIVNFYGDGVLCVFDTPAQAMSCASTLQSQFIAGVVPVRIGLHSGTVVFEGDQVYGDSVNLASRIESMGVAGAVLFSERVRKDIKNLPEFEVRSLGQFEFKNVEEPMELFALSNEGLVVPSPTELQGKMVSKKGSLRNWILALLALGVVAVLGLGLYQQFGANEFTPTDKSIAVLPFRDLSPQGDQGYFGDGIAEEVLNALSKLEELKVAGRISSFSFRDQPNVPLEEIGQKLQVSTILTGSIRKNENQIRVTADLVNVADGFQIWSERYDMELKDIFTIQETIAQSIVNKFKLTRMQDVGKSLTTKHSSNLQAYEHYLKGNFYFNKTIDGWVQAIGSFEKAIELDPNYEQAYLGLAKAYFGNWLTNFNQEAKEKSIQYCDKALELNPQNPDALHWRGNLYLTADWDWQTAQDYHDKAIALGVKDQGEVLNLFNVIIDPNPKLANKAIKEQEDRVIRDPLSVEALLDLNRTYLLTHQFEKAIANAQKVFELDPDQRSNMRHIGEAYMWSGQPEKSLPYFERAITQNNYTYYNYITNLTILGRKEEAIAHFEKTKPELNLVTRAFCYIALEEPDSAFAYLDRAIEEKDPYLLFYKVMPHFNPIREDPRYVAFEKKMDFPVRVKD